MLQIVLNLVFLQCLRFLGDLPSLLKKTPFYLKLRKKKRKEKRPECLQRKEMCFHEVCCSVSLKIVVGRLKLYLSVRSFCSMSGCWQHQSMPFLLYISCCRRPVPKVVRLLQVQTKLYFHALKTQHWNFWGGCMYFFFFFVKLYSCYLGMAVDRIQINCILGNSRSLV